MTSTDYFQSFTDEYAYPSFGNWSSGQYPGSSLPPLARMMLPQEEHLNFHADRAKDDSLNSLGNYGSNLTNSLGYSTYNNSNANNAYNPLFNNAYNQSYNSSYNSSYNQSYNNSFNNSYTSSNPGSTYNSTSNFSYASNQNTHTTHATSARINSQKEFPQIEDVMAKPQPSPTKCTCKPSQNRIPRPRNAFILFRQKYHQSVLDENSESRSNPEVSRELGRRWRNLSREERDHWNQLAEEEKQNHRRRYPNYRYLPRRNGKNSCPACQKKQSKKNNSTSSAGVFSATGSASSTAATPAISTSSTPVPMSSMSSVTLQRSESQMSYLPEMAPMNQMSPQHQDNSYLFSKYPAEMPYEYEESREEPQPMAQFAPERMQFYDNSLYETRKGYYDVGTQPYSSSRDQKKDKY